LKNKTLFFLLLSILGILGFTCLIVFADIEFEYHVLNAIVDSSVLVEPQIINAVPVSDASSISYLTQVRWTGNATQVRLVTDPFLGAYLKAYGITRQLSWDNQSFAGNYLIPDKISGLLYEIRGLPHFRFVYRLLDYKFNNTLSGLEIPNPVVSLYHRFNNSYTFLTAIIYITPLLGSNNTLSSVNIKLEWWKGEYDMMTGNITVKDLSSTQIMGDYNAFKSNGVKIYLLPNFYSYVDPNSGLRYIVFGFGYEVSIPNYNQTFGSFAWETLKLYNVSEPNFDVFQKAVQSVYGWKLWVGEGVYYYMGETPILFVLPSPYILYTEIKASIDDPVVYDLTVNYKKLYDLAIGDKLAYYKPPPAFVSLYQSNQQNNTFSVDIAFVLFFALGVAAAISLFLPQFRFIGIFVFGFIVYIYSPDTRIIILTVFSGIAAILDRWVL